MAAKFSARFARYSLLEPPFHNFWIRHCLQFVLWKIVSVSNHDSFPTMVEKLNKGVAWHLPRSRICVILRLFYCQVKILTKPADSQQIEVINARRACAQRGNYTTLCVGLSRVYSYSTHFGVYSLHFKYKTYLPTYAFFAGFSRFSTCRFLRYHFFMAFWYFSANKWYRQLSVVVIGVLNDSALAIALS